MSWHRHGLAPESSLLWSTTPTTKGKGGTTIQVTAVQITKLVTKDTVDSGPISVADAAELFGKREGFTVGEPAVEAKATRADAEGYDF